MMRIAIGKMKQKVQDMAPGKTLALRRLDSEASEGQEEIASLDT